MHKNSIVVPGLVLAGLYVAYRAWNINQSIDYFQYGINNVRISISNIINPLITFNLTVFNPNKTSVPINEAFGVISYNGTQISTFRTLEKININGQETRSIPMEARVSAISVITAALRKSSTTNLQFTGMVKTSFFDFPISKLIPIKS
jgi:LEA14-like dessication related protein